MKKFHIDGYDSVQNYYFPWPVEPVDDSIEEMASPDEIVHSGEKRIRIKFTYPLSTEAILEFDNPRGSTDWTRAEIFSAIRKGYNEIYYQEDMAQESVPYKSPYGIWGHSIYDLVIEFVQVNKKGILELGIGS